MASLNVESCDLIQCNHSSGRNCTMQRKLAHAPLWHDPDPLQTPCHIKTPTICNFVVCKAYLLPYCTSLLKLCGVYTKFFFLMAAPFEQMTECKCLVHHFKHISSKLNLMYLVSLETLLDISITCCQTEQCLASQHEPVMTELLVGQPSGRVIKQQYCCL